MQGGIVAVGAAFPSSRLDVRGNQLQVHGDGLVVGTSDARISENDISAAAARRGGNGIVLAPGLVQTAMEHCQVVGNRISGVAGHGITIRVPVQSAMIKQNIIEAVGDGGIMMEEQGSADGLSIENNQLRDIAPQANATGASIAGIRLLNASQAAVTGNLILGVGQAALLNASRVGIQAIASPSVRIAGNEVVDIGPASEFVREAVGIEIWPAFDYVDVVDNVVRRSRQQPTGRDTSSRWYALRIIGSMAASLALDNQIVLVTGQTGIWGVLGNVVRQLPRSRDVVMVRGNVLEAHGGAAAAAIVAAGDCTFQDNRCLLLFGFQPVVEIGATALIVSANYVRGTAEPAGVFQFSMALQVDEARLTVLGNITSTPIQVHGTVLDAPWAPLNVVAP